MKFNIILSIIRRKDKEMKDKITTIMNVNENEIRVMRVDNEDYISFYLSMSFLLN